MVRLKSQVYYLDLNVVEEYSNIRLRSKNNEEVRLNLLILAAIKSSLVKCLNDQDEDHLIITEFSKEELESVLEYSLKGHCDNVEILQAFGIVPANKEAVAEESTLETISDDIKDHDLSLQANKIEGKFVPMTKKKVIEELTSVFIDEEITDPLSQLIKDSDSEMAKSDTEWSLEEPVMPKVIPILKSTPKSSSSLALNEKNVTNWDPRDPKLNPKVIVKKLKTQKLQPDPKISRYSATKDPEWTPKVIVKAKKTRDSTSKDPEAKRPKVNLVQKLNTVPQIPPDWQFPKPIEAYKFPPLTIKIPDPEKHDQGKKFMCSKCPKRCAKFTDAQEHELKYHFEHYNCPNCYKVFALDDIENFRLHLFKHSISNKPSNKCKQCGKLFRANWALQKHMKRNGPYHDDECALCPFRFSTFKEHQEHVEKDHNGVWKFKCGYCKDFFDAQNDLKDHLWYVHQKQPRSILEKSKKSHQKTRKKLTEDNRDTESCGKPLDKKICEECGKSVRNLLIHMKISHGTSSIKCAECPKFYKSELSLEKHMIKVHIKIPCSRCGEMVAKGQLSFHMEQKHVDILERKFKCEYCGKGFAAKYRLRDHINIHTGEKPHKCKFCNAGFANKANKAAHEKSHLGVKRKK